MRAAFEENRDEIAALIVEPIPGNMGVVLPRPAYLPLLRSLCDEHGALLIFDEVITGFRVGRGGAQELYGVRPDLTCLGKIVGGGLPLGVYGGRADVMDVVAPVGPVYQAGTLSGNPLAVAAGLATLKRLDEHAYLTLEMLGRVLEDDLGRAVRRSGVKARLQRIGSAFTLFFSPEEVVDLASAKQGRHRPLRQVLPRHAGPRLHAAAGPVRGRVPLARAHDGGHADVRDRRPRSPRRARREGLAAEPPDPA